MLADLQQAMGAEYGRIVHQCGFSRAGRRQDKAAAGVTSGQRHRQRAADGTQHAGERELAGKFIIIQRCIRNLPGRGEDAEGDGQVETPRFLGQIGGRQVDGDASGGKFKAGILQGRAHAVTCFPHLGVRQPHQRHARQPAGQMRFDGD